MRWIVIYDSGEGVSVWHDRGHRAITAGRLLVFTGTSGQEGAIFTVCKSDAPLDLELIVISQ